MPAVKSADEATKIALSFLKESGWGFPRAIRAHRRDSKWLVEVDVGALTLRSGTVEVDARTGSIMEYDLPQPIA